MSKVWQRDVLEFHRKFAPERIGDLPCIPEERLDLLLRLIQEEYMELSDAMIDGDLPDTADAMVDLIYVILGAATTCGIAIQPVWDAVQSANMAKTGSQRGDGKVTKGLNWVPPDISGVLARQRSLGEIYPEVLR